MATALVNGEILSYIVATVLAVFVLTAFIMIVVLRQKRKRLAEYAKRKSKQKEIQNSVDAWNEEHNQSPLKQKKPKWVSI
jgi:biopolymer transport protein ExbB/TolQ